MVPLSIKSGARKGKKNVRPNECFYKVLNPLKKHIPLPMQGKYKLKDLYGTLIGMTAERLSVHSVDKVLFNCPSETTMRHHLAKLNMSHLVEINNQLLSESVLKMIDKEKEHIFIVDETDDPYYGGVVEENKEFVVGGKTKKSTNHFYRYITLYIDIRNVKFTLAVLPVKKDVPIIKYIQKFMDLIRKMELKIKVLLMDRGFYSTEIFSYLEGQNIPYIIPVKEHGVKMKELLNCRCSHRTTYTMGGKCGPMDLTVAIIATYLKGKFGKHGVKTHGYIIFGIDWKPKNISKIYEKRFSIESSYRIRNIVRPRTSTRSPEIRYLMALISMLFKNIWVAMQWLYFSPIKRGPRTIDKDKYRFDQFRIMIWSFVAKKFKLIIKLPTLRPGG